jgi:hypothetical protein
MLQYKIVATVIHVNHLLIIYDDRTDTLMNN